MIHFKRYKKDWALSNKLDQFIIDNSYKYPFVVNNNIPETLFAITEYYNTNKHLAISDINSDNTIFANSGINLLYRAWHDFIHIEYKLLFTLEGELEVYNIMQSQLPNDYYLEKFLLYGDIVGQTLYHNKYNKFPSNQREFVIDFLTTGKL